MVLRFNDFLPLGLSGRRVYRRLGSTMNADEKLMTIPDEYAGQRLDQALARMFPEYSRSRLKSWLLAGSITVDGGSPRPRDAVLGGEQVTLHAEPTVAVAAAPEPIALDIVHEDDALMVINKPVGLVVHPGAGNPSGTLMNGLLNHSAELEQIPRAGIVHRLDKDTSGLLLIAKTLESHTALVRLLGDREISRSYLAVCNGVLTGGGTIDEPVGRHPVDRKRMSIRPEGKPAVTHYTVIERFAAHTYISVVLETGRTHQIRVHFAHRRHALVGDPVYGGRLALPAGASDEVIAMLRSFRRQALHARKLEFVHPSSGEEMRLEVEPPADFGSVLEVLRKDVKS
jgi:23S rRNA pseudouridine1911/1915/1917 synthase